MGMVNMHEAKSRLSELVGAVESGAEEEIVIARKGKPAARLVPLADPAPDVSKRLGIAFSRLHRSTTAARSCSSRPAPCPGS